MKMNNSAYSNSFHQPIFAPVNQRQPNFLDDLDLSDLFAEYLNDGGADAFLFDTQQQNSVALPTGGIKTAFHTGNMMQQQQQLQQRSQEPITKKAKLDTSQRNFQQAPAAVPTNLATPGSGITHRIGYFPSGVSLRPGVLPQSIDAGVMNRSNVVNDSGHDHDLGASWPMIQEGGLSDQTTAERRQRNREHAKRSRVRKKFLLESLQAEVRQLQSENETLRMLIQSKIPQHAQQIINECCTKNPLFDDGHPSEDKEKKKTELISSDFSLIRSLTSGQQNFVLSDPRLPDNPIVYASTGFYELTGYKPDQVLGRNCRFLQGPGTDPKAVDVIRTAVANGTDATTCILNYKADGTPFWNQFFVAALRDSDDCIVNYVGVQCAVDPEDGANALEEKVNLVMPLAPKADADADADKDIKSEDDDDSN